jgi:hypothetical protein
MSKTPEPIKHEELLEKYAIDLVNRMSHEELVSWAYEQMFYNLDASMDDELGAEALEALNMPPNTPIV